MQIKAFRVRKFRNIEDSGEVELLDALTCVVGKNQAGKSALLRALSKFNPHLDAPYDLRREWPRGQRNQRNKKQTVCEVRFTLSSEELKKLGEIAGQELTNADIVVTKDYEGKFKIQVPEDATPFPSTLHPDLVNSICQGLPKPPESVRAEFQELANRCIQKAEEYAREGRFKELDQVCAQRTAALEKLLSKGAEELPQDNESQFIEDYKTKVTQVAGYWL